MYRPARPHTPAIVYLVMIMFIIFLAPIEIIRTLDHTLVQNTIDYIYYYIVFLCGTTSFMFLVFMLRLCLVE